MSRSMNTLVAVIVASGTIIASGCARPGSTTPPEGGEPGTYAVDAGGRPIRQLEAGSSLHVGGRQLKPSTMYEFRVAIGDQPAATLKEAMSFARSSSNRSGAVPPFVLWYQSGVIGCSERPALADRPFVFRSFDDAERALGGQTLTVSVHEVERDLTGRAQPMTLRAGAAAFISRLPIARRSSPVVFASDAKGCLVNSQLASDGDMYVSGRNFRPGEAIELSVVANQRSWSVDDSIGDLTGIGSAAAPERVQADQQGRFTTRVWERANQRRGAYDVVAHRLDQRDLKPNRIAANDIISYLAETGFLLYLRYPVGGPTMDLAGRPLVGSPYFEFADSFAETNDPVWGAVDPTYVPAGHAGGTYAAYYTVAHKDVAGWIASNALTDVSGGIEIHPVKAGCVNGTDVIIWNPPLTIGDYDVVVDFGSVPAASAAAYVPDGQYNDALDFLDGSDQIGFIVAKDPYEVGTFAIGEDSYSQDDFFATLGSRSNVDLRAVVRYPATSAGPGAAVAPGPHPLFIIEHGNHSSCNTAGFDGNLAYDAEHTGCPSRELNHMGYMGLLERLASHGVIAISIDAYDLTGNVPQLIPERSDLILKHLELWSHMNNTATFSTYPDFFAGRFAGHVDMNKISVSGHSRGGEASVGAYVRNAASATPLAIGSVSSIAPVDGQSFVLPDVPYFVILPAADGDVCTLSGQRIFDRAGSALVSVDATTKSGIYVYGASHNFFNTVWAGDGDDGAAGRDDFIAASDQQRLGEAFLAAFARVHLNSEGVYEDLFRGRLRFPSFAGLKVFPIRHEKSHAKLESGSGAGASATAPAATASVASPSVHQTQVLRVTWSGNAGVVTYTLPAAKRDASGFEVLTFRVAQTNAGTNPVNADQDFIVELAGGGHTKATFSSRFGRIPRPYNHIGWCTPPLQNVMTTVRIPLHSFIMNNAGVTLNSLDTVRILFSNPGQGEIYVDDLEFSR
jgi:hypothetical protein